MIVTIKGCQIELVEGDITNQAVDAIVNAANSQLAGGGGVDGAIHRRGGSEIMEETDRRFPHGCATGSAVVTGAGNLDAKFVLHAVGPIWNGGDQGERDLLRSAYKSCLKLAVEHECQSIAFPSLSTGAYSFPIESASKIALATAIDFLELNQTPKLIRFVLFGADALEAFERTLQQLTE